MKLKKSDTEPKKEMSKKFRLIRTSLRQLSQDELSEVNGAGLNRGSVIVQ